MNEIEIFYNLEEPLQNSILSEETAFVVYNVGERNGLSQEKIGEIGRLTRKVLMKQLSTKDFEMELELKTGINSEVAKNIAEKIDKDIFDPVRIYLEKRESVQFVKKEEDNAFVKQKHIFKNGYYRESPEE